MKSSALLMASVGESASTKKRKRGGQRELQDEAVKVEARSRLQVQANLGERLCFYA